MKIHVNILPHHRRCEGKVRYGHELTALKAIGAMAKKGLVMSQYRCQKCHGWHIGHSPWDRLEEFTSRKEGN